MRLKTFKSFWKWCGIKQINLIITIFWGRLYYLYLTYVEPEVHKTWTIFPSPEGRSVWSLGPGRCRSRPRPRLLLLCDAAFSKQALITAISSVSIPHDSYFKRLEYFLSYLLLQIHEHHLFKTKSLYFESNVILFH